MECAVDIGKSDQQPRVVYFLSTFSGTHYLTLRHHGAHRPPFLGGKNSTRSETHGTGTSDFGRPHLSTLCDNAETSFANMPRIFNHPFIESSERKNIYDGVVKLEGKDTATLKPPAFQHSHFISFPKLARDESPRLQVVGERSGCPLDSLVSQECWIAAWPRQVTPFRASHHLPSRRDPSHVFEGRHPRQPFSNSLGLLGNDLFSNLARRYIVSAYDRLDIKLRQSIPS